MEIFATGRSGDFFKEGNKVFRVFRGGKGLARLINTIFYGAPDLYSNNEHAGKIAEARNEIAATIVDLNFRDELRVARSNFIGWNSDLEGMVMKREYVDGHHIKLQSPWNGHEEYTGLLALFKRLRPELKKAGMPELIWHTRHNKGITDFLVENGKYVWLDTEAGRPSVFGKTKVRKLLAYIKAHETEIDAKLGNGKTNKLEDRVAEIVYHQRELWKTSRTKRGIEHFRLHRELTDEQAGYYQDHPIEWYRQFAGQAIKNGIKRVKTRLPAYLGSKVGKTVGDIRNRIKNEEKRKLVARYSDALINKREHRLQISEEQANSLREEVTLLGSSKYTRDFALQLSLNIAEKLLLQPFLIGLKAANQIDWTAWFMLTNFGGVIVRTSFTLAMMIPQMLNLKKIAKAPKQFANVVLDVYQEARTYGPEYATFMALGKFANINRGIALPIGMLPHLGPIAYPSQATYDFAAEERRSGEFIVDSTITRIGRTLGGENSRIEHLFNKGAYALIDTLKELHAAGQTKYKRKYSFMNT